MNNTNQLPENIIRSDFPLDTRPRKVALLGLGPSIKDYLSETARKKSLMEVDEVWGINTSYRAFKCDKIWIMDNLEKIGQNYPDWSRELKLQKTPIITCLPHDDYPTACPYPLHEVEAEFKEDYFSNTVAYAIAYAIYIGVEELYLFGIDFHYPNAVIVESGLGCVGYWLGIAKSRGVHYKIPGSSTLLDANLITMSESESGEIKATRLLYGYDYNPQDAKRKVDKGVATEQEMAIAEKSYRPTDLTDPKVREKLGMTEDNVPQMEPE